MGEKPILEIANSLAKGWRIEKLHNIRGTTYLADASELSDFLGNTKDQTENTEVAKDQAENTEVAKDQTENIEVAKDQTENTEVVIDDHISKKRHTGITASRAPKLLIPSYEEVVQSKRTYAKAFMEQYNEQDSLNGRTLVQRHGDKYVVQNPPPLPMTVSELDRVYALPYERTYHPSYIDEGGIPAINEVEFSITSHRGCYGGCSFCALNFHQGRVIQKRSQASILNEAKKLIWQPGFKGYIHDVGGPTANFRSIACERQKTHGTCKGKQCLYPQPCKNLKVDHSEYLELLRKIRQLPEVKKVFIRSGIRYDYLMLDKNDDFFKELCEHHVSGQLKVAPEHVVDRVLEKMGKPGRTVYDAFVKEE
jgi:uncharacterized radical SAM protein YgiQ